MLDKLPEDILGLVFDHLSFKEIYNLHNINLLLRTKLNNMSTYVITKQIVKHQLSYTKEDLYSKLTELLLNAENSIKSIIKIGNYNPNVTLSICKSYVFFNNSGLNKLFIKILIFFLQIRNLKKYTNIFELFIFYNLFKIHIYKDITDVMWNIKFLHDFSIHNKIKEQYFTYILTFDVQLNLEHIYIISKNIITLEFIQRILAYRPLELFKTKFIDNCDDEKTDKLLEEIISIKFNRSIDEIINYNYSQIKSMIKRNNCNVFNKILSKELEIINRHIYIRNPYTNLKLKLNSPHAQNLLYKLQFENPNCDSHKHFLGIQKHIKRQQGILYSKFFNLQVTF